MFANVVRIGGYMKKNTAKIIKMQSAETTPVDVAISMVVQNLFATYGEKHVRSSMKVLFGLSSKQKSKAA